jgi:hypothetical protein
MYFKGVSFIDSKAEFSLVIFSVPMDYAFRLNGPDRSHSMASELASSASPIIDLL